MKVPSFLLKRLYVNGSLTKTESGFSFKLKNVLAKATITGPLSLRVNGEPVDPEKIVLAMGETSLRSSDISADNPIAFDVGTEVEVRVEGLQLDEGEHTIEISTNSKEYGELKFDVKDKI